MRRMFLAKSGTGRSWLLMTSTRLSILIEERGRGGMLQNTADAMKLAPMLTFSFLGAGAIEHVFAQIAATLHSTACDRQALALKVRQAIEQIVVTREGIEQHFRIDSSLGHSHPDVRSCLRSCVSDEHGPPIDHVIHQVIIDWCKEWPADALQYVAHRRR